MNAIYGTIGPGEEVRPPAVLSALAKAGIVGMDATTTLDVMRRRLSAPTQEAQALLDELGISTQAEDADAQLARAFVAMTHVQRNDALVALFGSDAMRAAAVLYLA